jgi:hypothetical protein
MYPLKKDKAQVSAPFELLVAIIVMLFVIIAGNYALKNLSENTCLGNKRQDFSNLISSLREVVLGSDLAYRTIDFKTKACYSQEYEKTILSTVQDKAVCERYCGSGTSCILLYYSYIDEDKYEYKYPIQPICTYLSTNLVFGSANECLEPDDDTSKAIDPTMENIPIGSYRLFKISNNLDNVNYRVCMVKIR